MAVICLIILLLLCIMVLPRDYRDWAGEKLDSRAIVDIVNLIGTCVVAGNVRRSATLALAYRDWETKILLT